MFKTIKLSIAAIATSVIFGAVPAMAAGTAHLSMSPASGSHVVGSTFAVSFTGTSTDAVNVVQADLSFNQSLLQLVGFSCNAAAFEFAAPGSCGTATPKTGSYVVGTASFKVLAAGPASINFATSSHMYSSSNADVWDGNTAGANFSFAAAGRGSGGLAPAPKPAPQVQAATAPEPTPAPAPAAEAPKAAEPTTAELPAAPANEKNNNIGTIFSAVVILLAALAYFAYDNRERLAKAYAAARKKWLPAAGAAAVVATTKQKASTTKKSAAKKKPAKKVAKAAVATSAVVANKTLTQKVTPKQTASKKH